MSTMLGYALGGPWGCASEPTERTHGLSETGHSHDGSYLQSGFLVIGSRMGLEVASESLQVSFGHRLLKNLPSSRRCKAVKS